METLASRLKLRREERGMTQEMLIDFIRKADPQLHVTRMTISNIENEIQASVKDKMLLALIKVLGCEAEWLVYGIGPKERSKHNGFKHELSINDITSQYSTIQRCPILSWEQIQGKITDISSTSKTCYYPNPVKSSLKTFILKVKGDSMSPRFMENDLIFVDPEQVNPTHNHLVISRLPDAQEATFKQLQFIDNQKILVALNPNYPPYLKYQSIDNNCTIIGTVVAHMNLLNT